MCNEMFGTVLICQQDSPYYKNIYYPKKDFPKNSFHNIHRVKYYRIIAYSTAMFNSTAYIFHCDRWMRQFWKICYYLSNFWFLARVTSCLHPGNWGFVLNYDFNLAPNLSLRTLRIFSRISPISLSVRFLS